MPHIKVIQPEEATGDLKSIYDQLQKQRGQIAEVHKIQSLRPESITKHMDLYMEIMFSKSQLSRAQREMMAVVVSKINRCPYCVNHHGSALNHYWRDAEKLSKFIENYDEIQLSEKELALCHFAQNLTKDPSQTNDRKDVEGLRNHGFTDEAILDASLVVSYFNFVNRMVLSLGVTLEEDQGENYNY